MGKRKKKKLKEDDITSESWADANDSTEETSSDEEEDNERKYKPYYISDYNRRYPEDSILTDYVVFVESSDEKRAIGTRDMMSLSSQLKRFNKGIKYLQSMNKYKIGVHFEKPTLANAFLNNKTFLNEFNLKTSIPAAGSEVTGVITNVPANITNFKIFKLLSTHRKIICVKRMMKKVRAESGFASLQPTATVAITFASNILPDHVDLNGWRFLVKQYIPPVKQCYICLRYNHLAKFCKNSPKCSICTGNHTYKDCKTPIEKATCIHCKGNHISISGQCPVKQQKIKENQAAVNKSTFVDLFNKDKFPEIKNKKNPSDILLSLLDKDDNILNIILNSITKIIMLNKSQEKSISSQLIKDVLIDTAKTK